MKTFFIATTEYPEGTRIGGIEGYLVSRDFCVFDGIESLDDFIKGVATYNALDECVRLWSEKGEQVRKCFCILADGIVDATSRAYDLRWK